MRLFKLLGIAGGLVILVGCATNDAYYAAIQHANEQNARIELARAHAEAERLGALRSMAVTGDDTSRMAAIMGLSFAGQNAGGSSSGGGSAGMVSPRAPESPGDTALRWASVVLPSVTNLYGINRNAAIQSDQISANRDIAINTNETMLGFGHLATDRDIPITGGNDERLIFPTDPDAVVIGDEDDQVLNP